jgi:hypothetical protein
MDITWEGSIAVNNKNGIDVSVDVNPDGKLKNIKNLIV